MKTVGQRIIKARALRKWSRPQLAEKSGVPYPTLAGLENGDQQTSSWIPAIAAATGVNALWLADGKGEMRSKDGPASQSAQLDPSKVTTVARALRIIIQRRNPAMVLNLEDPVDAELFCLAYAELETMEASDGVAAGAVIADLMAAREERRNAGDKGDGQQAGSTAGSKTRRSGSSG